MATGFGEAAAFALLFALAGGACAANAPRPDAQIEHFVDAVIDAAASSRDARVLMAAAQFGEETRAHPAPPQRASRRDALYERALRLGADDPVVWWVAATDCPASESVCNPAAAVQRLRQLAPNNAAGWLLDGGAGDDTEAHFQRAVHAVRLDTYGGEHVRALHAAASLASPPTALLAEAVAEDAQAAPERVRLALSMSKWLAHAMPTLHARGSVCRAGDDAQREACIALGRLLTQHSSGLAEQRLGNAWLLAALPPGAQRNAVEQSRRRLDWQLAAYLEALGEAQFPAALLHWLQPNAHELTVVRATLQDHGIALDPPPAWRSDRESVLPAFVPSN